MHHQHAAREAWNASQAYADERTTVETYRNLVQFVRTRGEGRAIGPGSDPTSAAWGLAILLGLTAWILRLCVWPPEPPDR